MNNVNYKNNDFVINNLNFSFEKSKPYFFENLDVTFPAGKLSFIKGKNGVGKSTLLRVLQGDIYSTEYLSGYFLEKVVRLVSQKYYELIVKSLNIRDNISLMSIKKYPKIKFIKSSIDKIDYIDLPLETPVAKLSGGQQQILAILMVIIKETNVLLLDEPTASLDNENSFLLMDFLKSLAITRDIPIIIVSHNNKIIEKYADLIFCMKKDILSQKRLLLK